ncbi:MAG TPA: FxsA family protein [Candidatus Stackebrandtia excrementipullorum]|nr:FxsA family protein [Candidatus Stackebrandtia excrementipullorum]
MSYRTRLTLAVYLLAELAAFAGVVMAIGIGWTIVVFLATGLVGAVLLRVNGVKAMRAYREAILERKPPGQAVVTGVLGVSGAILLLLPGIVTDVVGLLCVLPGTRSLLRPLVTRFLEKQMDSPTMTRFFGPRVVRTQEQAQPPPDRGFTTEDVIEGEVVDDNTRARTREDDDTTTRSRHDSGPKPLS